MLFRPWLASGTPSGVTSCRRLSAAPDRPGLEGRTRISLRSLPTMATSTTSALQPHRPFRGGVASPAGLTRGSIFFARRFLKWDGLPGQARQ